MLKLVLSGILLVGTTTYAAMEYQAGRRCVSELEKLSDAVTTYEFVRTGPRGSYGVLEIPYYSQGNRKITYYSSQGVADINTESMTCSFDKSQKDKTKTSEAKLLELFQKREEQLQSSPDALKAFSKDCAADFPTIYQYLDKNHRLPQKTDSKTEPSQVDGAH